MSVTDIERRVYPHYNYGGNELIATQEMQYGKTTYPFQDRSKLHTLEHEGNLSLCEAGALLPIPLRNGRERITGINIDLTDMETDGTAIVPFHPELGYQIDKQDSDLETRRQKLLEHGRNWGFGILEGAPLSLVIKFTLDNLIASRLLIAETSRFDYRDPFGQRNKVHPSTILPTGFFPSLRCLVFANGLWEARVSHWPPNNRSDLGAYFEYFYPADRGPLPADDSVTSYDEDDDSVGAGPGHNLYFTTDHDEISQIGIQFIPPRNLASPSSR